MKNTRKVDSLYLIYHTVLHRELFIEIGTIIGSEFVDAARIICHITNLARKVKKGVQLFGKLYPGGKLQRSRKNSRNWLQKSTMG